MKVAKIKGSTRAFFHYYLTITYPYHKIRKRERGVLAEFLYYRYMISNNFKDGDIITKLLFDVETKTKICHNLHMHPDALNQCLTHLRRVGAIDGKVINKKYIPNLKEGEEEFTIAYKFILHDNEKGHTKKKGDKKTKKNSMG